MFYIFRRNFKTLNTHSAASSAGMQDGIPVVEWRWTEEVFPSKLTRRMQCWRVTATGAVSKIYKGSNFSCTVL